MASIADEIAQGTDGAGVATAPTEPGTPGLQDGPLPPPAGPSPGGSRLLDWLREVLGRKTGPGDLSAYQDHPVNPTGDRHGARIARGLEGITGGASGLAVVDLLLGAWGLLKAKAKGGGAPGV